GIIALRERQKRNLLSSLFMSQGVPMLVAGDEMGRTQGGNNNAYCQDNEISWVDWKLDDRRRRLLEFTRKLIALRHRMPVLQRRRFFVGDFIWDSQSKDLTWLRPDGEEMSPQDWQRPWSATLAFMLGGDAIPSLDERGQRQVGDGLLVLLNAHHEPVRFKLPEGQGGSEWLLELDTNDDGKPADSKCSGDYEIAGRAMVAFRQPLTADATRTTPTPERAAEVLAPQPGPAGTTVVRQPRQRRRAGVTLPLFSLRRKGGWGIGDISDIAKFASWAHQAGFTVWQMLPVNAVNESDASPYAAVSAFALDPVYWAPESCEDFTAAGGRDALSPAARDELAKIDAAALVGWPRARALKMEAIHLAFQHFFKNEWKNRSPRARELISFMRENRTWLDDYALFSTLHAQFQKSWLDWSPGLRDRTPDAIAELRRQNGETLLEHSWIQWQLDEQWKKARRDAAESGVELMGDMPFTVSMDSADVWSDRAIFRTDQRVGTPPQDGDKGQDWGLPVYDWVSLGRSDFAWLRSRAARAGALFSLYRIDHVAGFYRTFFRSADGKASGFSPGDERSQVRLGETIMRLMRHFGEVVGEDLGNIPTFLRPSLDRMGVPGFRVIRWEKDGTQYRDPSLWPQLSVSATSTHDTVGIADWWDHMSAEE
ncbi:MAG TPA: 4-alpha-glucanotransferase, partial [Polyangiaceae bacterium]